MSEILRLDPFQMVRGFTVPEIPTEPPVLFDACFNISVTPPYSGGGVKFDVPLCGGGTVEVDTNEQWEYGTFFNRVANNELYEGCENLLPMTVIGRESGARYEIPWDLKAFLGWPQCLEATCYVSQPGQAERWNGQNAGGLAVVLQFGYYSQSLGFIDSELCDIELRSPPRIPIVSITNAGGGDLFIETSVPHEMPAAFQNCLVRDTNSIYDRGYQIKSIDTPTRLRVNFVYLFDVAGVGTVERYYSQI